MDLDFEYIKNNLEKAREKARFDYGLLKEDPVNPHFELETTWEIDEIDIDRRELILSGHNILGDFYINVKLDYDSLIEIMQMGIKVVNKAKSALESLA